MPKTLNKTMKQARIEWMLAHCWLWEGWPMTHCSFGNDRWNARRDDHIQWLCVLGLKQAGLISASTNWFDVSIDNYVHEARKQMGVYN